MKKYDEIEEFGCDDYMYWMRRKDTIWSVSVVRFDGSISLNKFSKIEGERVDRFSTKQTNGMTEIYLLTNNPQEASSRFIGRTRKHEAAEQWVSEVNQLYERQTVEAAVR